MTPRRDCLGLGWLLLGAALLACGGDRAAPPDSSLLLVTLDTTRADRLEPYGAEGAETPNLQALADAGVLFERAYAVTPVTLPSHASIFTGLDPIRHAVRNNGISVPAERYPVLAEILGEAGLRTGAFVSAAVLDSRFGLARGFETYDDDLSAGGPRLARLVAERPARATVDAALRWLDRLAVGDRFFLWVHLFDPHASYSPPAPFAERFSDRPYDGEIAAMDREVGRLLAHERLSSGPLVVMAIGDHGESLGEHGEQTHAMLAYDSTLRIPWIVRAPELDAGRVESPVSQVDLLPTALGLLGIPPPADLEMSGIDLAPVLRGGSEPLPGRHLYAETMVPEATYGWAPLQVVRDGPWKLVQAGTESELYDLEADPGELRNLSAAEPRRVERLRRVLAEMRAHEAAPVDEAHPGREATELLRDLGYLSTVGGATRAGERPNPRALIETHLAFERAADLFHRRQLDRAIPELALVLEGDPQNLAALMMLAKARSARAEHDEAKALADRAVARASMAPEAWTTLGVVQARAGQLEPAFESLRTALDLPGDDLDARLEIALLLFRMERAGEGGAELAAVLADDPTNPRALIARAERVEQPAGLVAEAERTLRGVLTRDPSRVEGWRALGRLLEDMGQLEEAVEAYRAGLDEVPGDGLLHALLGMALGRGGRIEEGEASLRRASELLRPGSALVHNALAGLHLRRGEWAAAEAEARQALDLDPDSAGAWSNLGAALEEHGDPAAALDAYSRALQADPGFWQAEFNRALLLRVSERWQEAATGYRAVLEKVPGHAKSHFELGLLYLGPLADPAAARRHLSAAIEAEPDHPRAAEARRLLSG